MKKKHGKLRLNRDTLRPLTGREIQPVVGALNNAGVVAGGGACPTDSITTITR